jgi:hypothetical protein
MTPTPEDVELVVSARMIADSCTDGESSREWYDTLMDIRNLPTQEQQKPDREIG